jgi:hypothetical protein
MFLAWEATLTRADSRRQPSVAHGVKEMASCANLALLSREISRYHPITIDKHLADAQL